MCGARHQSPKMAKPDAPDGWSRAHRAPAPKTRAAPPAFLPDRVRYAMLVKACREAAQRGDMAALAELNVGGLSVAPRKAYKAAARAGHLHIMAGIVAHTKASVGDGTLQGVIMAALKVAFVTHAARDARQLALEHYLALSGHQPANILIMQLCGTMRADFDRFVDNCAMARQWCASQDDLDDAKILDRVACAVTTHAKIHISSYPRVPELPFLWAVVESFCAGSDDSPLYRQLMHIVYS